MCLCHLRGSPLSGLIGPSTIELMVPPTTPRSWRAYICRTSGEQMQLARLINFVLFGYLPNWVSTKFGNSGKSFVRAGGHASPLHMAKKGGSSLTGGTGDVNPQLYRLSIVGTPTTSTTTSVESRNYGSFPVPVPKFSQKDGKAIVMEVLKCRWNTNVAFPVSEQTSRLMSVNCWLSTKSFSPSDLPGAANPYVIDYIAVTTGIGVSSLGNLLSLRLRR